MKAGTSRCSNATVSGAQSAGGCTILLKNEEVARNCMDNRGQHLLFQQHVPDTLSIYFDARVHGYEVGKTASFSCPKITEFAFYCACIITKLAILISQGNAATQLRCSGNVINTLLQIYCRIQQ